MKNELIFDKVELFYFYKYILPELKEYQVHFLNLISRSKYCKNKQELVLTKHNSVAKKIVRQNSFKRFMTAIHKLEANQEAYIDDNEIYIPKESLALYINLAPSDSKQALKLFNEKISNIYFNNSKEYVEKTLKRLDALMLTCYSKATIKKSYIDIDLDIPKEFAPYKNRNLNKYLNSHDLKYYWVDTHSGYHLLIDKNASNLTFSVSNILDAIYMFFTEFISNSYSKTNIYLTENCSEFKKCFFIKNDNNKIFCEIKVNENNSIPIPGTLQGGYKVKVLNKHK